MTSLIAEENRLTLLLGCGWYRSHLMCWNDGAMQTELVKKPAGITAELLLTYTDGTEEAIRTDESWTVSESRVRFSELYDGELYDATFVTQEIIHAVCVDGPTETLIPQEGQPIREQERVCAAHVFTAPKDGCVIDFGQELTGFLEVNLTAKAGAVVDVSFAEVLDKDGNFYTGHYRGAKCRYHYVCQDGQQTNKTKLTFYGFRYIRVNEFPGGVEKADESNLTGIAVHSDMKRTGSIRTSDPTLNQLFSNTVWGQKSNFVDVPTDCPPARRAPWLDGRCAGVCTHSLH